MSDSRVTAIFGGTFNPVHNGHLYIARFLLTHTDVTRIIFVPVNIPSHKDEPYRIRPASRLDMLRLGVGEVSAATGEICIDTCDIDRGGVSYTLDTIADLSSRYAISGKPRFVIGDDLVGTLTQWHRWDELREAVHFIIFRRTVAKGPIMLPPHCRATTLENKIVDISSSEIRDLLQAGKAVNSLVPESVYLYIIEHGLYSTV